LKNQRSKRQTASVVARNNLFVEYLAVIDSGTYNFFVSLYGSNMPSQYINDYINIHFTQLINGVIKVSRFILFFNLKHYLKDESKISSFTEK
jgi:hypothetical protein